MNKIIWYKSSKYVISNKEWILPFCRHNLLNAIRLTRCGFLIQILVIHVQSIFRHATAEVLALYIHAVFFTPFATECLFINI